MAYATAFRSRGHELDSQRDYITKQMQFGIAILIQFSDGFREVVNYLHSSEQTVYTFGVFAIFRTQGVTINNSMNSQKNKLKQHLKVSLTFYPDAKYRRRLPKSRSSANIGFAETGKTYLYHLDFLKIRTHGIPDSPTTFSITVGIVLSRVHARSTGDINQLCVEFATPSVCLLMWR